MNEHWNYLQTLRSCRASGKRLGHITICGEHTFLAYVLDGEVWAFGRGYLLGPVNWFEFCEQRRAGYFDRVASRA